jgi:hypothetical protein
MDPTVLHKLAQPLWAGEGGSIQTSRATFNFVTSDYTRCRPKWRNWQTRRTQNPVPFGEWGFDSPLRHLGASGLPTAMCSVAVGVGEHGREGVLVALLELG